MEKIAVKNSRIVAGDEPIPLRGVNLGNWLNIEDFMIGLSGTDWQIKAMMRRHLGEETTARFFDSFVEHFISEKDIAFIAKSGFNFVRLPFNYRYFESDAAPGNYNLTYFQVIDRLFDWCETHGLYVLLDFHAAPGGHNTTPPADNAHGFPLFWTEKSYQDRCAALWVEMARRYGNRKGLLGYDLLNEPITNQYAHADQQAQTASMNRFYARLIQEIRRVDGESCIVLEGNVRQSGGIRTLDPSFFRESNMIASFHYYPMFQLADLPGLNIGPDELASGGSSLLKENFVATMEQERDYIREVACPMLLGEFGFFSNKDLQQQESLVRLQLETMREWGWHWCLWSYKDVGLMGLAVPHPDSPWRNFIEQPAIKERNRIGLDAYRNGFDIYIETYGKNEETRILFDYAYNNAIRGIRLLQLNREIADLAKLPPETIAAMPESFQFDRCTIATDNLKLLQEYL